MNEQALPARPGRRRRIARSVGWIGALIAAAMFAWLVIGTITPLPGIIEVFGVQGIRTPASISIAALLTAAIGFHEIW